MAITELPILEITETSALASAGVRPFLINRDPGPDEIGAPRTTGVCFDLFDPVAGILAISTIVEFDGLEAFKYGAALSGFSAVVVAITDGFRYCVTPDVPFASEQVVDISVFGESVDNDTNLWLYSFEVEDVTAPVLLAAQARGREIVRLSFDEPISIPSGAAFSIAPLSSPAVGVVVLGSSSSVSTIDLILDRPLSPGASYEVTVDGVEDLNANLIDAGSTALFSGFEHSEPEGRDFDIWEKIPNHNRRADSSGDLLLLSQIYQELFDLMLCEIDSFRQIYDIERASDEHIDLLLFGLGNPFDTSSLSAIKKRRLAGLLVQIYQSKGTAIGIIDAVRFFLELEITIIPLGRGGLGLGEARLDVDLILGSSDLRILYSFVVVSPRELTEDERAELTAIVVYMKPAREHLAAIREPVVAPGAWALGLDSLGVDTILS